MKNRILSIILTMLVCVNVSYAIEQWVWGGPGIPLHALRVGTDTNGKALYLCRGKYNNSLQIGKTWRNYPYCNIAYGGKEQLLRSFKIFVKPPQTRSTIGWRNIHQGLNPIALGRDTNGTALYACQVNYLNSIQVGKTWANYSKCNISYAGKEILLSDYKILKRIARNIGPRKPFVRPHHRQNYQCIKNITTEICGYNCLQSGMSAACAQKPGQYCMADNFHNIACGYQCIATPFKVVCSQYRNENCVKNAFNEVRCGHNCRVNSFNEIQCG